jgi:hypothetical protein
MDCAPTGQRSTPTDVTSVPHWSYLLLWPVQIHHDPHFIWTPGLHVISCTRNRILRVSNFILEGQEPLLHTSAVVPLGKECYVSTGKSSTYVPKTVPRIYWTEFHGSTGKSSRYRIETVPVIYWKQFHVCAENCSMDLLDRVSRINWKEFQGSNRNSSSYLLETVSGTYLKWYQVFTWKSSKHLLERVPGIYRKDLQW